MPELLSTNDLRQRIRERIDSREWWVMPWLTAEAPDLSITVEQQFYTGEASGDFEAYMGPVPVTMGHKRRMTAEQAAVALSDLTMQTATVEERAALFREHDILVAGIPDEATLLSLIVWEAWVQGRTR